MSGDRKTRFCALPPRAMADKRLGAADFRVLAAIAYHDRFGNNGQGCYADPRRLAERAGIDPRNLARHTADLQEYGYIKIKEAEGDKRRRVYRVIYDEDVKLVVKSDVENDEIVVKSDVENDEIVVKADLQAIGNTSEFPPLKRSCETEVRDTAKPVEARQKRARPPPGASQRELPVMQDVNQYERNRRLNEAGAALVNELVRTGLVEPIEARLGTPLGESKQYSRAIEHEAQRSGSGIAYMRGILRRQGAA